MPTSFIESEIKLKLLAEDFGLTEDDFGYHETDLYVNLRPGVLDWLKANLQFPSNMQMFTSQKGSNWNGAGKRCADLPFLGRWPAAVLRPCPVPTDREQKHDITCAECGTPISFEKGEVYVSWPSYVCRPHALTTI